MLLKRRPKNEDLRPKTQWTKTKTLWTKTKTLWTKTKTPLTKTKTPLTKTKTPLTKTTDASRWGQCPLRNLLRRFGNVVEFPSAVFSCDSQVYLWWRQFYLNQSFLQRQGVRALVETKVPGSSLVGQACFFLLLFLLFLLLLLLFFITVIIKTTV